MAAFRLPRFDCSRSQGRRAVVPLAPVGRDPVAAARPADRVVVPGVAAAAAAGVAAAEQQFAKSVSERRVAEGVDERIDRGVGVAEPQREQVEVVAEPRRQTEPEERLDGEEDKVGNPADAEGQDDRGQADDRLAVADDGAGGGAAAAVGGARDDVGRTPTECQRMLLTDLQTHGTSSGTVVVGKW